MTQDSNTQDTRKLNPRNTLPFEERQSLPVVPWSVRLHIEGSDEVITVHVKEWITLGRKTSERYEQQHIDLSPFNAADLGVSRIHAAIHARQNGLTLQDLSSTNGTQLNGYAVAPYQNVSLENEDEIILGALKIWVTYEPAKRGDSADDEDAGVPYDAMLEDTQEMKARDLRTRTQHIARR